MERDDIIMAHFAGEINAILKASQGWPLCDSPLELMSLKYSENGAKTVPLIFLLKVEVRIPFSFPAFSFCSDLFKLLALLLIFQSNFLLNASGSSKILGR